MGPGDGHEGAGDCDSAADGAPVVFDGDAEGGGAAVVLVGDSEGDVAGADDAGTDGEVIWAVDDGAADGEGWPAQPAITPITTSTVRTDHGVGPCAVPGRRISLGPPRRQLTGQRSRRST